MDPLCGPIRWLAHLPVALRGLEHILTSVSLFGALGAPGVNRATAAQWIYIAWCVLNSDWQGTTLLLLEEAIEQQLLPSKLQRKTESHGSLPQ